MAPSPSHPRVLAPAWAQLWRGGWAPGFLFWCAFLLALEPDNLMRAAMAGASLSWSAETARITGAGLLGACASPITVWLIRRWPVTAAHPGRALPHLAAPAVLAPVLVLTGHLLAAAFLNGAPDTADAVAHDLASNVPLVAFCLLAFDALLHAARPRRRDQPAAPPTPQTQAQTRFHIRDRRGVTVIAAAEIDWMEAQGNYVGLHVGPACHLLRDTLASVEARLDPTAFARTHRGALVALSRVRSLRPLPGGDALAVLSSGQELRVSRTYAAGVRARL